MLDTLTMCADWVEREFNSVSDNPLFDPTDGVMAMGGNFYGGYLSHGMDYLKICGANLADLLDRQLMLLFDPKTAVGLPPNLANWRNLPAKERHLHHGLKGLHQVASALTSEVCGMSMPSSVFSRSSESHNQDKVSLGMSAATSLATMLDKLWTITALHMICLAQALDLGDVRLHGGAARECYVLVRQLVPFVQRDQALGTGVAAVASALRRS